MAHKIKGVGKRKWKKRVEIVYGSIHIQKTESYRKHCIVSYNVYTPSHAHKNVKEYAEKPAELQLLTTSKLQAGL